jgi:RNA polymerase sigma factor (sigma-70 family)
MATLSDERVCELQPALLAFATRLDARDAEDIVQEAFLGVLRRATVPERLRAFLMASVRNEAFSRYRRASRRGETSLDAPTRFDDWYAEHEGETAPLHARLADPLDVADEATTRVALADALTALAGEPYAAAMVDYGRGYRYREIAAREGTSIMAVKSGIHRLRHGPLARLSPW